MTLTKKKIFEVRLVHETDTDPDLSWIGEYTDELRDGVIVRDRNEYYEKLPREMDRDANGRFSGKGDLIDPLPERGREYRGFRPYAGGEKVGTKEYYEYGMQDYRRMEDYNNMQWCFIGIKATAKVGVSLDGGENYTLETISSGGLWGIESDSDKEYFREVEAEEMAQLKSLLLAYGFGRSTVARAVKNAVSD